MMMDLHSSRYFGHCQQTFGRSNQEPLNVLRLIQKVVPPRKRGFSFFLKSTFSSPNHLKGPFLLYPSSIQCISQDYVPLHVTEKKTHRRTMAYVIISVSYKRSLVVSSVGLRVLILQIWEGPRLLPDCCLLSFIVMVQDSCQTYSQPNYISAIG